MPDIELNYTDDDFSRVFNNLERLEGALNNLSRSSAAVARLQLFNNRQLRNIRNAATQIAQLNRTASSIDIDPRIGDSFEQISQKVLAASRSARTLSGSLTLDGAQLRSFTDVGQEVERLNQSLRELATTGQGDLNNLFGNAADDAQQLISASLSLIGALNDLPNASQDINRLTQSFDDSARAAATLEGLIGQIKNQRINLNVDGDIELPDVGSVDGAENIQATNRALTQLARTTNQSFASVQNLTSELDLFAEDAAAAARQIVALDRAGAGVDEQFEQISSAFGLTRNQFQVLREAIAGGAADIAKIGRALQGTGTDARQFAQDLGLSVANASRAVTELIKLRRAGIDSDQAFQELNRQLGISRGAFNQLDESIKRSERNLKGLRGIVDNLAKGFGQGIGQAAFNSLENAAQDAGRAVSGAFVGSFQNFATFEQSVRSVGARLNSTNEDLAAFRDQFRDIAADSRKTTQEVANAAEVFVGFGATTEDVQTQLESVVTLSEAVSESAGGISEAAESVQVGFNVFGAQLEENGEDIDDFAAKIATLSNQTAATNLEDFTRLFAEAGSGAVDAGQQLDGLLSVFATLRDVGIPAQKAVTGLRTAVTRLADPTSAAAAVIEEFNIQAFDPATGDLDIIRVIEQLDSAFSDLSNQERIANINQIFGAEAGDEISALIGQIEGRLIENIQRIGKESVISAAQFREALNQGPGAAVAFLGSQLDALSSRFGEAIAPIATGLFTVFDQAVDAANGADVFAPLQESADELFETLTGGEAGAQLGEALTATLQNVSQQLADLVEDFNDFLVTNPDAFERFGEDIQNFASNLSNFAIEFTSLLGAITRAVAELSPVINAILGTVSVLVNAFTLLPGPLQVAILSIGGAITGLIGSLLAINTAISALEGIRETTKSLGELGGRLGQLATAARAAAAANGITGLSTGLAALKVQLAAITPLLAPIAAGIALVGASIAAIKIREVTAELAETTGQLQQIEAELQATNEGNLGTQKALINAIEARNAATERGAALTSAQKQAEQDAQDRARQNIAILEEQLEAARELQEQAQDRVDRGGILGTNLGTGAFEANLNSANTQVAELEATLERIRNQEGALKSAVSLNENALTEDLKTLSEQGALEGSVEAEIDVEPEIDLEDFNGKFNDQISDISLETLEAEVGLDIRVADGADPAAIARERVAIAQNAINQELAVESDRIAELEAIQTGDAEAQEQVEQAIRDSKRRTLELDRDLAEQGAELRKQALEDVADATQDAIEEAAAAELDAQTDLQRLLNSGALNPEEVEAEKLRATLDRIAAEIQAEEEKIADLRALDDNSIEAQEALEEAVQRRSQLALSLLETEFQLQERNKQAAIAAIQEQLALDQQAYQRRENALNRQLQLQQFAEDSLQRQSDLIQSQAQLLEANANLQESLSQSIIGDAQRALGNLDRLGQRDGDGNASVRGAERRQLQRENEILGFGDADEEQLLQRLLELERQRAEQRRTALEQQQAAQLVELEIQATQNRLATERLLLEQRIAALQARANELAAEATLDEAIVGGNQTEIDRAQNALDLAREQTDLIQQGIDQIEEQNGKLEEQEAIQRRLVEAQQAQERVALEQSIRDDFLDVGSQAAAAGEGDVAEAASQFAADAAENLEAADEAAFDLSESIALAGENFVSDLQAALTIAEDIRAALDFGGVDIKYSGRRHGGEVRAGTPYKVGESALGGANYEWFIPGQSGRIFSNRKSERILKQVLREQHQTPADAIRQALRNQALANPLATIRNLPKPSQRIPTMAAPVINLRPLVAPAAVSVAPGVDLRGLQKELATISGKLNKLDHLISIDQSSAALPDIEKATTKATKLQQQADFAKKVRGNKTQPRVHQSGHASRNYWE